MLGAPGSISLLLGIGRGEFAGGPVVGTDVRSWDLEPSDVNGDGRLDLVAAGGTAVLVLLGHGDGSFREPVRYTPGVNSHSVAAADLNGDGSEDLAVANYASGNVSVLLGVGDGSFSPAVDYPLGAKPPCFVPRLVGKKLAVGKRALSQAHCR